MLKRNFLGFRQFKPSFAHNNSHISQYSDAVDEVFGLLKNANPKEMLSTPVAHTGFSRLTKE